MANQSEQSRYRYIESFIDEVTGNYVLHTREPYRYRDSESNITHRAAEHESWWGLAARYYRDISDRPSGLWWAIMDFQPTPVLDPTLAIRPGSLIVIPHPLEVVTEILGTDRTTYQ